MLTDTHAHLDFPDFEPDREEVLARARDAGLEHIIVPGIDLATSRAAVALAERYDMILAAVGIHPNDSHLAGPGDLDAIRQLVKHPRVVAIGEVGLDYYRDRAPREVQARIFAAHLELARETGLPVIVHFRNVEADGINLIGPERFRETRGVFHSFGGSAAFAERIVNMGWYVGFTGPLTYRKSDRAEVARAVPLDRILVETDSPFLTPQRHRGTRNEPAYVSEIAEKLAEIKGITLAEIITATSRNVRELFGIGG